MKNNKGYQMSLEELDSIISNAVKNCEKNNDGWDVIPDSGKKFDTLKQVDKWNKRDFHNYFKKKFHEVLGEHFGEYFGVRLFYNELSRLSDVLRLHHGVKPSNDTLKEYIDWFFDDKAKKMALSQDGFYLGWLTRRDTVLAFTKRMRAFGVGEFRAVSSDSNKIEKKNQDKPLTKHKKSEIRSHTNENPKFTSEAMETSLGCSRIELISEYGIIISYVWLVRYQNFTEKQSHRFIIDSLHDIVRKHPKMITKIIENTTLHTPYPIWCELPEIHRLIKDVEESVFLGETDLEIRFHSNAKNLAFLDRSNI